MLPRWTGWLAYVATALCVISMADMYAGPLDYSGFWNPGGWGPAIVANFPLVLWFLVVGIVMVSKPKATAPSSLTAVSQIARPQLS